MFRTAGIRSSPVIRLAAGSALLAAGWVWWSQDKPFHIDDVLFLHWARVIAPLPSDPPVNPIIAWERFGEPLREQVRNNTPGWALLIAACRRSVGESERILHWLQWPFAAMFLAGTGLLARSFGLPVRAAVLLTAASPLWLVPAASVMPDLAALGPAVLGLAVWRLGATLRARILATLLMALGAQMKQSALPLIVLLVLDDRCRPVRDRSAWVLAAAAAMLGGTYPVVPPGAAEGNTLPEHLYWLLDWGATRGLRLPKLCYGVAVLSGTALVPLAWVSGLASRWGEGRAGRRAVLMGLVTAALVMKVQQVGRAWGGYGLGAGQVNPVPGGFSAIWFGAAAVAWIAWMAANGPRLVDGPARWLVAWLGLSLVASIIGTPFPAVRFLVPALPPLILLWLAAMGRGPMGQRRTGLVIAGTAAVGLSLAHGDAVFASCARMAAARGAELAAAKGRPLVTTGSWGLRWYVEQAAGRVLTEADDPLAGGAILLAPALTDHREVPPALRPRVRARSAIDFTVVFVHPLSLPVRTIPAPALAGSFHGGYYWLPWVFTESPVETVEFLEIAPVGQP